jgi:hypothetical protein
MVNNNGSDEAIRVLVEQYKENMKTLTRGWPSLWTYILMCYLICRQALPTK